MAIAKPPHMCGGFAIAMHGDFVTITLQPNEMIQLKR